MSKTAEKRSISVEDAGMSVEDAAGVKSIQGYAAVYGAWSQDLGGFVERFAAGAFTNALAGGADVRYLVNHDPSLILGRTKAGTLSIVEDDRGLRTVCNPPPTDIGEHYAESVRRGDITGMSFRFYVLREEWNFDASPPQRTVLEAEIDDVCLATYPAYLDTSAAVRSLEASRPKPAPPGTPALDSATRYQRLAEAY